MQATFRRHLQYYQGFVASMLAGWTWRQWTCVGEKLMVPPACRLGEELNEAVVVAVVVVRGEPVKGS